MNYPSNPPPYPIVNRDPTFGEVFSALRSRDWQIFALATGLSIPFGYWAGRPVLMRQTMFLGGSIGALFGLMMGYQNSFARLTGYGENGVEIAKYAQKQTADTST